jgi:hypothetical protein
MIMAIRESGASPDIGSRWQAGIEHKSEGKVNREEAKRKAREVCEKLSIDPPADFYDSIDEVPHSSGSAGKRSRKPWVAPDRAGYIEHATEVCARFGLQVDPVALANEELGPDGDLAERIVLALSKMIGGEA